MKRNVKFGIATKIGIIAVILIVCLTAFLGWFFIRHETDALTLDSTKARNLLGWHPRIGFEKAVELSVEWYRNLASGGDAREISMNQINELLPLHMDSSYIAPPIPVADQKT